MSNYMEKVAEMFGVKLGERFRINGKVFWFDKDGTGRARPVLIADLTDTIELSDIDLYLI